VGETTRRVEGFLTRGFVAGLYQKQLAFRFLERSTGVSPVCIGVLFGFDKRKQMDQFHTAGTAMPPSFAMQSPISKRHWYYFLLRGPVLLCSSGEHLLKIRPRVTRYSNSLSR
jgi:hypothetical protein